MILSFYIIWHQVPFDHVPARRANPEFSAPVRGLQTWPVHRVHQHRLRSRRSTEHCALHRHPASAAYERYVLQTHFPFSSQLDSDKPLLTVMSFMLCSNHLIRSTFCLTQSTNKLDISFWNQSRCLYRDFILRALNLLPTFCSGTKSILHKPPHNKTKHFTIPLMIFWLPVTCTTFLTSNIRL